MQLSKKRNFIINFIYYGLIIGIIYVVVQYGLGLFAPFVPAFIIAWLVQKPASFIENRSFFNEKSSRIFMVLIFFLIISLIIFFSGSTIINTLISIFYKIPSIFSDTIEPLFYYATDTIEMKLMDINPDLVSSFSSYMDGLSKTINGALSSASFSIVTWLSGHATAIPGKFINVLLTVISTFFIAADFKLISNFIMGQFSPKGKDMIKTIGDYVVGTLFVCIRSYILIMTITFVELSIGLTVIGVEGSVFIAAMIAIFDILPVLGTGGIMIPWAIIALILGDFSRGIGLFVIYIIITIIRNILEPRIVGKQIGLHPVVTLISMFVGVSLFGGIGLFGLPIGLSLIAHLNNKGLIHLFNNTNKEESVS